MKIFLKIAMAVVMVIRTSVFSVEAREKLVMSILYRGNQASLSGVHIKDPSKIHILAFIYIYIYIDIL